MWAVKSQDYKILVSQSHGKFSVTMSWKVQCLKKLWTDNGGVILQKRYYWGIIPRKDGLKFFLNFGVDNFRIISWVWITFATLHT